MGETQEGGFGRELAAGVSEERHNRSWYDRSHEELVHAFQAWLPRRERTWAKDPAAEDRPYPLAAVIHKELQLNLDRDYADTEEPFFTPILHAWDAIAYDLYEPGTGYERYAGHSLSRISRQNREPMIELTDPLQVKILDALADVTGIRREKGQKTVAIPEHLQNYEAWSKTPAYQQRLAQARTLPPQR